MLFSESRRARRAAVALTSALAITLTGTLVGPAQAANRVTPRNFTGYGFDQCVTPSQESMDTWLTTSPYWAVGVYIAGDNRFCGDTMQTALTPEWVSTQLAKGWRVLPITVGPQAPCYVNPQKKVRIDNDPARHYAGARRQGRIEARTTVRRARALGIAPRSTLWYDIEAYDIGNDVCRESTLSFLSAWTRTLHNLDYVSGVYSSASTGIRALDDARVLTPRRYTMPDRVWVAEWTHRTYRRPPRMNPPSLLSTYLRDDGWLPGRRMRQYQGGHNETYGGVTINVDSNYLDLGRGTRAGRAPRFCRGQRVDYPRYRRLHFGTKGGQVRALQCFLKRRHLYSGKLTYFYNHRTVRGVKRFQRRQHLRINGRMWWSTWTLMLSQGRHTPVLKVGSGGNVVRKLQRSLNAATREGLAVDGIFGPETTEVVRSYQREVDLPRTGVVDPDTWVALRSGRL